MKSRLKEAECRMRMFMTILKLYENFWIAFATDNIFLGTRIEYRTCAKISRAYSKLTRFLDALIFEPCLFSRHDYSKYP